MTYSHAALCMGNSKELISFTLSNTLYNNQINNNQKKFSGVGAWLVLSQNFYVAFLSSQDLITWPIKCKFLTQSNLLRIQNTFYHCYQLDFISFFRNEYQWPFSFCRLKLNEQYVKFKMLLYIKYMLWFLTILFNDMHFSKTI